MILTRRVNIYLIKVEFSKKRRLNVLNAKPFSLVQLSAHFMPNNARRLIYVHFKLNYCRIGIQLEIMKFDKHLSR